MVIYCMHENIHNYIVSGLPTAYTYRSGDMLSKIAWLQQNAKSIFSILPLLARKKTLVI